jgi:hypothetical protein
MAGKGDDMNPKKPEGQYRTTPDGEHRPMAYVWGGGTPSYVTEATYRAKGYSPAFEMLPTEDQYDAAQP